MAGLATGDNPGRNQTQSLSENPPGEGTGPTTDAILARYL